MRKWLVALALVGVALTQTAAVRAQEAVVDVPGLIDAAALRHGLAPRFLRCLAWQESNWQPWQTSRAGDRGLMQFKQGTWNANAWRYGWAGASPYDPEAAADVAAGMIASGMVGHWPPARRCGSPWA